ncbi:hypothetical protein DFH11DRAFT_1547943 [Phellopilus nigrolimitatus]|nr:hypothetical protein DFH11DRAFT_1547943 [Phellopilus nigrolimitatus]
MVMPGVAPGTDTQSRRRKLNATKIVFMGMGVLGRYLDHLDRASIASLSLVLDIGRQLIFEFEKQLLAKQPPIWSLSMRAAPLRRFTTLVFAPSLFPCSFKKIERVNRTLGAEPHGLVNPSARSTRSRSAKFQTNLACKMDVSILSARTGVVRRSSALTGYVCHAGRSIPVQ